MSGRRIAALILGWIATLGNAVPLLFVVLLSLTSKGASSMVVLFPVVVLMFTGVIWLVLGLIGLALTADMMDVRLPRIMCGIGVLLSLVSGLVVLTFVR